MVQAQSLLTGLVVSTLLLIGASNPYRAASEHPVADRDDSPGTEITRLAIDAGYRSYELGSRPFQSEVWSWCVQLERLSCVKHLSMELLDLVRRFIREIVDVLTNSTFDPPPR